MKKFWNLVIADLKFQLWDMKKYPIKTLIQIFILTFIIVGFFQGAKLIKGISVHQIDTSLIIGYVLFMTGVTQIITFPGIISGLREIGVLEQMYLSPVEFEYILISKVIIKIISKLIASTILLYLIMFFTKKWFEIKLIEFYLLFMISLFSIFGLGLIMAGLELLYRKIIQINFFIMIGYGALMTLPAYPYNLLSFFPFIPGAYTINQIIVHRKVFPPSWYLFITLSSIFYFALGLSLFRFFERKAKKLNRLCKY